MSDDLGERLRRLGLRVDHAALAAFLTHVHKSHLGPTETLEQLVDLEERSRVAVNLARRTRFACLGSFKTIDRFDWDHPEKIDRPLIERLFELEYIDRGENVLLKGGSGRGKDGDRAELRPSRTRRRLHRLVLHARLRACGSAHPVELRRRAGAGTTSSSRLHDPTAQLPVV